MDMVRKNISLVLINPRNPRYLQSRFIGSSREHLNSQSLVHPWALHKFYCFIAWAPGQHILPCSITHTTTLFISLWITSFSSPDSGLGPSGLQNKISAFHHLLLRQTHPLILIRINGFQNNKQKMEGG
jgi:hypothetical protein